MVARTQCNNTICCVPFKWVAMKNCIIELILGIGISAESKCQIEMYDSNYFVRLLPHERLMATNDCSLLPTVYAWDGISKGKLVGNGTNVLSNTCSCSIIVSGCDKSILFFSTHLLSLCKDTDNTSAFYTRAHTQTKMERKLFDVFQSHFELSSRRIYDHETTTDFLCELLVPFPFSLLNNNWRFINFIETGATIVRRVIVVRHNDATTSLASNSNDGRIESSLTKFWAELYRFSMHSLNLVTALHCVDQRTRVFMHEYADNLEQQVTIVCRRWIRSTTVDERNWIFNFIFDALLKWIEAVPFSLSLSLPSTCHCQLHAVTLDIHSRQ